MNIRETSGLTPLLLAAHGGYLECLKCLIRAGADVNAVDMHGNSALWKAQFTGQFECLQELLKAGAIVFKIEQKFTPYFTPNNMQQPQNYGSFNAPQQNYSSFTTQPQNYDRANAPQQNYGNFTTQPQYNGNIHNVYYVYQPAQC